MSEWTNNIHEGDAVETLNKMPESSVHCVMTSPPYYNLRDYDEMEQIGTEDTLSEYISELISVGEALKQVLRDDGSWWLNLGDSYSQESRNPDHSPLQTETKDGTPDRHSLGSSGRKNKMLVPHRVAIALQQNGWIVRNDVSWHKPDAMPSSVTDRLNTTTEQIFHLTQNPQYWYDLDAVREPHETTNLEYEAQKSSKWGHKKKQTSKPNVDDYREETRAYHSSGKNPGDVFEVTKKPYAEAHTAVYPPELCEKPLKSSCPPKTCAECGTPYERDKMMGSALENPTGRKQKERAVEIFDQSDLTTKHLDALRSIGFTDAGQAQDVYDGHGRNTDTVESRAKHAKEILGGYAREFIKRTVESSEWVTVCNCTTDDTQPGVVLDPFAGAGTTCLVAKRLNRRFVGVDLNPEYVALAQKRVGLTVDEPERLTEDNETTLTDFTDTVSE